MRQGKYQKNKRRIPLLTWVLLGMAVLGTLTGGVVAYLSAATVGVENSFTEDTDYDPVILESFDGQEKKNVLVSVPGPVSGEDSQRYAVYVRAAIVVTWRRGDTEPEGKEIVLAQAPADTDYQLEWNDTDWFLKDGYYYHKAAVAPGTNTAVLINSCRPLVTKDGYVLNVEIMAQTIQALGTTDANGTPAVTDAWGVQVDGGNLTPTNPSN